MQRMRNAWLAGSVLGVTLLGAAGCSSTPSDSSESALGPAPQRMPSPAKEGEACCYEDSLTGGQIFAMYCNYCHNAPNLSERPYAQFRNVAAHMRVRANLTGKEYAMLEYLARRSGQLVTRTDISEHVWDEGYEPFSNLIEVYIQRLRRKIDDGHDIKLLRTRRGEGYVLGVKD